MMDNTVKATKQKSRKQESLEHGKKQIFAGLDIGTTKVAVVIARVQEKSFEIIGVSQVPCSGLR
jgi:cell division ATPase FtsA